MPDNKKPISARDRILHDAARKAGNLADKLTKMRDALHDVVEHDAPLPKSRYGYPDDVHTPEQLAAFIDELWAKHKRTTVKKARYLSIVSAMEHMESNFIVDTDNDDELHVENFQTIIRALAPWVEPPISEAMLLKIAQELTPQHSAIRRPRGSRRKKVKRTIFWALASELVEAAGCGKHTPRSLETEWSEWNR